MANILIMAGTAVAAIAASRGTGAANLLTFDPKEVWQDAAVGTAATIDLDLGSAQPIDTVFLAAIYGAVAGATWTITGGLAGYAEFTFKAAGALRAVDAAGEAPSTSHALWTGASVTARYVRLSLTQPAGNPALMIGRVMLGTKFTPGLNKEWGAGRGVIDTGTATRLPSGGFGIVEGARLGTYAWSLGDLTLTEVDVLYALQLAVGETVPILVAEDPAATTGQLRRLHYAKFVGLKKYERRNPSQTRWEFSIEDWI